MKWRNLVKGFLFIIIAILFSFVTFYKLTDDQSGYMMLWRQVEIQPFNIMFALSFLIVGILELSEVVKK